MSWMWTGASPFSLKAVDLGGAAALAGGALTFLVALDFSATSPLAAASLFLLGAIGSVGGGDVRETVVLVSLSKIFFPTWICCRIGWTLLELFLVETFFLSYRSHLGRLALAKLVSDQKLGIQV